MVLARQEFTDPAGNRAEGHPTGSLVKCRVGVRVYNETYCGTVATAVRGAVFQAHAQNCETQLLPASLNNSAPTWRSYVKFDTGLFFRKSVKKIQVSLKSHKNNWHFTLRPQFFLERHKFHTKAVEKIRTHFMFNKFFLFNKIVPFMR